MPLISTSLEPSHGFHPSLHIKLSFTNNLPLSIPVTAQTPTKEREDAKLLCGINVVQRLPQSVFVDPYELKNYEDGVGNDDSGYTFEYWAVSRDLEAPVMVLSSMSRNFGDTTDAGEQRSEAYLPWLYENGDSVLLITLNELIEFKLSESGWLRDGMDRENRNINLPLHLRYGQPVVGDEEIQVWSTKITGNHREIKLAASQALLTCNLSTSSQLHIIPNSLRDYPPGLQSKFRNSIILPFQHDSGTGEAVNPTIWHPVGDATPASVARVEFGTASIIVTCFVFLATTFWRTAGRLGRGLHHKIE